MINESTIVGNSFYMSLFKVAVEVCKKLTPVNLGRTDGFPEGNVAAQYLL